MIRSLNRSLIRSLAESIIRELDDAAVARAQPPSGALFLLDADSIVAADGDPVATWTATGSTSNGVFTAAGAVRPTYRATGFRGRPCVDFAGAQKLHNALLTFDRQPLTIGFAFIPVNAGAVSNVIFGVGADTLDVYVREGAASFYDGGASVLFSPFPGDVWTDLDGGSVIMTSDATTESYINDGLGSGAAGLWQRDSDVALAAGSAGTGVSIGGSGTGTVSTSVGRLQRLVVYDSLLSAPNRELLRLWLLDADNKCAAAAKLVVFDGNSLAGSLTIYPVADSLLSVVLATLGATWTGRNFGIPSQTTPQMATAAATRVDPYYLASRTKNIVVGWELVNDLAANGPTNVYANYRSYCLARQAAGWKVVAVTMLPNNAITEADRVTINAAIVLNWATFADALANVAANINIGPVLANQDATYYNADQAHLNATGVAIAAGLIATAIGTI